MTQDQRLNKTQNFFVGSAAQPRSPQKSSVLFNSRSSAMNEFHTALGQCLDYQIMLEVNEPERELYLAVPFDTYRTFFQTRFARLVLERYPLKLIVYEPILEEILEWIK